MNWLPYIQASSQIFHAVDRTLKGIVGHPQFEAVYHVYDHSCGTYKHKKHLCSTDPTEESHASHSMGCITFYPLNYPCFSR